MIANLTTSERQNAFVIAAIVFGAGLAMAALGRSDVLGVHGVIVMLFAGVVLYLIMSSAYGPEPTVDRASSYYDDPTKIGIVLSMGWAVVGMFMGVWVAAQLAWPDLAFDAAWSSLDGYARFTPPASSLGLAAMLSLRRRSTSSSEPRARAWPARSAHGSCFSASTSSVFLPRPAIFSA